MGITKNYISCGIDSHLPAPSLTFIYLVKLPNFFIIKASPYETAACLNSSSGFPEVLCIFVRDAAQVVLPQNTAVLEISCETLFYKSNRKKIFTILSSKLVIKSHASRNKVITSGFRKQSRLHP